MEMKKSLQNKLKAYSAMSAVAAFGANEAAAQMNSTNLNFTGGYETYDIDIDGNGTVDFRLVNDDNVNSTYSNNFYTGGTWGYYYRDEQTTVTGRRMALVPQSYQYTTSSGATYTMFNGAVSYPLSSGTYVYSGMSFQSNSNGVILDGLLDRSVTVTTGGSSSWGGSWGPYTNTYNSNSISVGYFGGQSDTYIGVRFGSDGNTHYGWIRIGVSADGATWTVRETGYDAQQDVTAFTQSRYDERYAYVGASDAGSSVEAGDLRIQVTANNDHDFNWYVNEHVVLVTKSDVEFTSTSAINYYNGIGGFLGSGVYTFNAGGGSLNGQTFDVDTDGDILTAGNVYKLHSMTFGDNGDLLRYKEESTVELKNTVSLEELGATSTEIYTNNKTLFVKGDKLAGSVVRVFDMSGKLVHTNNLTSSSYEVNLNNANGIYVVSIENENGIISKNVSL